jgi:hypothetical protein
MRFEVLVAVIVKITVLWDGVFLVRWIVVTFPEEPPSLICRIADKDSSFILVVHDSLLDCMALHPRRP